LGTVFSAVISEFSAASLEFNVISLEFTVFSLESSSVPSEFSINSLEFTISGTVVSIIAAFDTNDGDIFDLVDTCFGPEGGTVVGFTIVDVDVVC